MFGFPKKINEILKKKEELEKELAKLEKLDPKPKKTRFKITFRLKDNTSCGFSPNKEFDQSSSEEDKQNVVLDLLRERDKAWRCGVYSKSTGNNGLFYNFSFKSDDLRKVEIEEYEE